MPSNPSPDNVIPATSMQIDIPGRQPLVIRHLILDYNGTIAKDGQLIPEVITPLQNLAKHLKIHILTADTHGTVTEQIKNLNIHINVAIIPQNEQIKAKQKYLQQLGSGHCITIGNGYNDQHLLRDSALGIATIGTEGAASACVLAADIITTDIIDALQLLLNPTRLIATLRC